MVSEGEFIEDLVDEEPEAKPCGACGGTGIREVERRGDGLSVLVTCEACKELGVSG